ncbi:hypothetical protein Godav_013726 [Gossypium davidsonii]|uniref:RNase H type-1 domain-containing protein n=1 Tax=Gossypium davidsonii TaxID=34287 RepID=A0A7J8RHQ4_GOSDV|nr:hypothetical protein [Gossypium davidsonii]
MKINFDASISSNRTNFGVLARDNEGFVIGGGEGLKNEIMSAEWAEIYAFKESINMACALNIKTAMVFEIDSASLTNKVKHHSTDVAIIGARVKDSIKASLIDVVTRWQISFVKKPSHGAGASGTFNVHGLRLALAPWCLGCVGVSTTIGNLGPYWCDSVRLKKVPSGAPMSHSGCASMSHFGGAPVISGAGASSTTGTLVPQMCRSIGQCQHLGASDVRDHRGRHSPPLDGPRLEVGCVPPLHGGWDVSLQLMNDGKWITGVGGRGNDFPVGQACAHRNVTNDLRSKFPISGKDLLEWLIHFFGLELGLPIPPSY